MKVYVYRFYSGAPADIRIVSQPILADEVQTFKALITIHKVLQEGHPIVLKEAQAHINWLESLNRGVAGGEGLRGKAAV
jgi:huntingtin-interacting protein 1-related protein